MQLKCYKIKVLWICLVSFFASLIFLVIFNKYDISGDAAQYDKIAWNMVSNHGYSLDSSPPYKPTNLREPAYVFFLFFIYKLFGHNLRVVYILQILLFSISCILIFSIAKNIFDERIATYAAFFMATCFTLVNYTIFLYSELFFMFLLIAFVYCILKAKDTSYVGWHILSGLLIAFMALCKAIMIFFIIPTIVYLLLNKRKNINIITFCCVFLMIVSVWMARNYYVFGTFSLANRGEQLLLARAYRAEMSLQTMKEKAVYSFSEYIGSKLFPNPNMSPRDYQFQEAYRACKEYQDYVSQGVAQDDINRIMKQKAISIIRAHPVKFLLGIPVEYLRLSLFMYMPSLNDNDVLNNFKRIQSGYVLILLLKGIYKLCSIVILLLVFIGFFYRRLNFRKEFILLAIIIYTNFMYGMILGYQRYAIPLIPFYFIYAIVAIEHILKRRYGVE